MCFLFIIKAVIRNDLYVLCDVHTERDNKTEETEEPRLF